MKNHYHPSRDPGGEPLNLFRTRAEERPFLDLAMTYQLGEWPSHLRKILNGPTRWANLVIGLAVDGAVEMGMAPQRVETAMHSGSIILSATVQEEDGEHQWAGSVSVGDGTTIVRGVLSDNASAEVRFTRHNSPLGLVFVPRQATSVTSSKPVRVSAHDLRFPFTPTAAWHSEGVPLELRAARSLSDMEEVVATSFDSMMVKTDVWVRDAGDPKRPASVVPFFPGRTT